MRYPAVLETRSEIIRACTVGAWLLSAQGQLIPLDAAASERYMIADRLRRIGFVYGRPVFQVCWAQPAVGASDVLQAALNERAVLIVPVVLAAPCWCLRRSWTRLLVPAARAGRSQPVAHM